MLLGGPSFEHPSLIAEKAYGTIRQALSLGSLPERRAFLTYDHLGRHVNRLRMHFALGKVLKYFYPLLCKL